MKYTIQKRVGRHTYKDLFQYYIGFGNRMSNNQGPLDFTLTHKWFTETYGWSAEIRQYADIMNWSNINSTVRGLMSRKFAGHPLFKNPGLTQVPEVCNPKWSWTNGYDDLRIYVATDKELAFFQLAHPISA